jgi:FkbM family methyltransferase
MVANNNSVQDPRIILGKKRRITRLIDEPRIIIGKLKKFHPNQCYVNLVAGRLVKDPFKTIIDVGANYGYFMKPARWIYPNSVIYAFEPVKEAFDRISNEKGFNVYNFGLGDKNKELEFYYNKSNEGSSTFLKPTNDYVEISNEKLDMRKLKTRRFDSLGIKIEKPCFLKIDTEGFEYFVLKGFGNMLNDIDVIQLEHHFKNYFSGRPRLSKIIELLESFGFNGIIQVVSDEMGCDFLFYRAK